MTPNPTPLRQQIDEIDHKIFDLLRHRLNIVRQVAEYKRAQGLPTNDRKREREILTRVTNSLGDDLGDYGRAIYRTMFDVSKLYEAKLVCENYPLYQRIQQMVTQHPQPFPRCASVALLNADDSYAVAAAERLFEVPDIMPMQNSESLYKAVSQGLCKYALIQIEDSTQGTAGPVYDQLTTYQLTIIRSVRIKIDQQGNYTRFICVSSNGTIYPGADRTTIMMVIQNKPGSLYSVLSKFNVIGANLIRLESRPLASRDFQIGFYFDIEASIYDSKFTSLLCELQDMSEDFHYFGTYNEII